jgi:hypothetical protein
MLHEGRWQVVVTDDGRVLTVPPPFNHWGRAPNLDAAA